MASVSSEDEDHVSLNVMPMLDIFSILILFLLMSFSTDPISHDVSKDLELPESKTINSLDEIPTVKVTKTTLMVNDKQISKVLSGNIEEQHLSQGAILPLYQELEKLSFHQLK